MMRALIPLAVLVALAVFFWRGLALDPTEIPSPLIDREAPAFALPSLADPDVTVRMSDFRGRPVLVNVWGSWCVGCHQEHDMLMRIAAEDRIPIVGLNWKDPIEDARRFLTELGDPYLISAQDLEGRVAIDWGVYGAPETFLVDADGRIRFKHVGPITEDIWRDELLPRIEELEAGA